jgi:hypothetical protein
VVVELDTSAEADRVQLEVLRRLGPSGRAALTLGMSQDMRRIIQDRIARECPHLDQRGRTRALVAYLYGEPLAAKAFGPAEPKSR